MIAPETGATSYGSGTLVDVRDQFGLVITNWHVVRDATGVVEVQFPDGFHSKARALKVDPDWDLAALVIWRPPVSPVKLATTAPRPGDRLTICGYGQGNYRAATGRCTQYYAPRIDYPQHMVELDVEARQGDSGGPIFNRRGELAGVLFGAGQGTTLGSFGGRVGSFLATLAPDIGQQADDVLVQNQPCPRCEDASGQVAEQKGQASKGAAVSEAPPQVSQVAQLNGPRILDGDHSDGSWQPTEQDIHQLTSETASDCVQPSLAESPDPESPPSTLRKLAGNGWYEQAKTVLAAVGLLAVALQALRLAC